MIRFDVLRFTLVDRDTIIELWEDKVWLKIKDHPTVTFDSIQHFREWIKEVSIVLNQIEGAQEVITATDK